MEGKICPKCGVWKVYSEFNKNKSTKRGYDTQCRQCRKEYRQANKEKISQHMKEYYKENKDKILDDRKRYHQENKDKVNAYHKEKYRKNIEKKLEYNKKYYEENKERIIEQHREYIQKNKEIVSVRYVEYHRKHYEKHREKIRKQHRNWYKTENGKEVIYKANQKRRALKNNVRFSPFQRQQILDRDNWTCQMCGCNVHDIRKRVENLNPEQRRTKAHIDHIIPISKGGTSEPKNLRVLCASCNSSKRDKQEEQLKLFN